MLQRVLGLLLSVIALFSFRNGGGCSFLGDGNTVCILGR